MYLNACSHAPAARTFIVTSVLALAARNAGMRYLLPLFGLGQCVAVFLLLPRDAGFCHDGRVDETVLALGCKHEAELSDLTMQQRVVLLQYWTSLTPEFQLA